MADYIPTPDPQFDVWQKNFITNLQTLATALGLLPADITPLTALQTAWGSDFTAHTAAQTAAQGARQAKDASRETYENALRAMTRLVQANPAINNEYRADLGITVPGDFSTGGAVGSEDLHAPVGVINMSERLRHRIDFYDSATPNRRAKPAGIMGCEIWMKVADVAPGDPTQYQFVALDTASPYLLEFPATSANQKAHYLMRWVSRNGQKGPWSETVTATIAG